MADCHRPSCERYVPPSRAFCGPDWRAVPKDLQRTVYASWGQVLGGERAVVVHHAVLDSIAQGLDGRPWDEVRVELGRPAVGEDHQATAEALAERGMA